MGLDPQAGLSGAAEQGLEAALRYLDMLPEGDPRDQFHRQYLAAQLTEEAGLVQLDFAEVFVNYFFSRRASGSQCEDGDQQQVSHLHGGLRPYDGRCLGRVRPVMMSAP